MRHALVGVLALAACAVPAGATSLLAVGEWITDAPPHVLEHVGMRLAPLFPERSVPCGTTVPTTAGPDRRRRTGPGGRPLARRPPQPNPGPAA
ncbi:transposase family protein, partial [Streptomyces kaempferi]